VYWSVALVQKQTENLRKKRVNVKINDHKKLKKKTVRSKIWKGSALRGEPAAGSFYWKGFGEHVHFTRRVKDEVMDGVGDYTCKLTWQMLFE